MMSVEAGGGLPRSSSRHRHAIETDKPSCIAKNLLKAGLCLLFGGALAGMILVGMSPWASLKDIWSSAPLALEDTDVLAGSRTGGVNSKALEEERQLISKVFAETPSKLFDWPTDAGESTDDTPTAWPSLLPTEENLKIDLWSAENHFVKSTKDCKDVPKWMQPDEGIWKSKPFANMTCEDLKRAVPENLSNERDQLCNFLSQGVFSVPSANEACCICGGGNKVERKCSNMVWNNVEIALNCDFIDSLPSDNIEFFCGKYGNATFVQDGLTLKEACCACGGGEVNMNRNAGRRHRHLSGSVIPPEEIQGESDSNGSKDFRDIIMREGLGESPGITNLEYLGLGYDLLRGNPRGSDKSELDPGFRYRVVRLVQSQNNLTVDGAFTVPIGTDVKYIHSCRFDKSSTEVSSAQDIRTSLQGEASFSSSESSSSEASAGLEINLGFWSFGSSYSQESSSNRAFSENSNVKRAAERNARESLVAFESKAICKEYQASFIPGYDLALDPTFVKTLAALPVPYDKSNRRHRNLWREFFDNYGTSYVNYLALGGKQVTSFSMTSQEYSSLVSESVDVSSTMSYEMSKGMSASASAKKGLAKGAESPTPTPPTTSKGGPVDNRIAGQNVISINLSQENKNEDGGGNVPDPSIGGSGSFSKQDTEATSEFARNAATAEAAEKVSKKNLKFTEFTLGGNPNADWRAWAATVASRPMPVQYEVKSLTDFMTYEEAVAANDAFQDLFKVALTGSEPILEGTTKFGVFTGLGEPLVQSTLDPNNDCRVLMQVGEVGKAISSENPLYELDDPSMDGTCRDKYGSSYDSVLVRLVTGTQQTVGTGNDPGVNECFTYCSGLSNSGDQVGLSVTFMQYNFEAELRPAGPNHPYFVKNGDTVFDCRCHYNAKQLPPTPIPYHSGSSCTIPILCGVLMETKIFYIQHLTGDGRNDRRGYGLPSKAVAEQIGPRHVEKTKCYKNKNYDSGDRASLHTFTDSYKGKINRPKAIFATPIRGFIGDSEREARQYPYDDGSETWKGGNFFALSSNLHVGSRIAVTSFGQAAREANQIPAFSFVSADSFGSVKVADDFLTGVVSPEGLVLSRNQILFDVSETSDNDSGRYRPDNQIRVKFLPPMRGLPVVVIFPTWYQAGTSILPTKSGQLGLILGAVNYKEFFVRKDTSGPVGFNFLAIGPDTPVTNVRRGTVFVCTGFNNELYARNNFVGFMVRVGYECSDSEPVQFGYDGPPKNAEHLGVLIDFNEPHFDEIPSVIVSPLFPERIEREVHPKCIVESITVSSARVKCGMYYYNREEREVTGSEELFYVPIPFSFVAIGKTVE